MAATDRVVKEVVPAAGPQPEIRFPLWSYPFTLEDDTQTIVVKDPEPILPEIEMLDIVVDITPLFRTQTVTVFEEAE